MAKKILDKVQCAEELERLMAKGMTQEQAEWDIIDRYDEVIFPDEGEDIKGILKKRMKVAHVYDKKKGTRTVNRKPNEDKRAIIAVLKNAITETFNNGEVKNVEREVTFTFNGENYSVTLTKHRKD